MNHVAALEIRIKLSELCYKSIPVDYTEDKKHIDLSTEPLTLVIANDLPPGIAGDMVKEVAIFRAHNGRPIVFATAGPDADAFAAHAERVIALPKIGSDLGFVLATVAGHLFGFHAARAIDVGAQQLKQTLTELGRAVETGALDDATTALAGLDAFVDAAATGAFDSGLGGRDVASLAALARRLAGDVSRADAAGATKTAAEGMPLLRRAFEETSRPVDTIRHQAKTVTVGTSRPDDALTPAVRDALAGNRRPREPALSRRPEDALGGLAPRRRGGLGRGADARDRRSRRGRDPHRHRRRGPARALRRGRAAGGRARGDARRAAGPGRAHARRARDRGPGAGGERPSRSPAWCA